MTQRYLWTLERPGRDSLGGFATLEELSAIVKSQDLPGFMPAEWIVATLKMDQDEDGFSVHESAAGWTLTIKQ